jgi:methyl-accepting chemotaxis protein
MDKLNTTGGTIMKSIQTKITIFILLGFLIALSTLGGLNYLKARQLLMDNIKETVSTQAVNSSREIGDWLGARTSEIIMMSATPVIQSSDTEAIIPFLSAAVKTNSSYDAMGYVNLLGDVVNSAGQRSNVADRGYFEKALKGEMSISDPAFSKVTGHLVAIIAVPVKAADGKVTGVITGLLNMDEVAKRILLVKVGQTGYAFVNQGDGLTIIHPNAELAMKSNVLTDNNAQAEVKAVNQHMANGEKGFARYQFGGIDRMTAYAPVPGVTWSLAVTVPTAEVASAISALTTITAVTIVVVLVVAAVFIIWLSRRISKPIQDLEKVANRIAGGDITTVKLGITTDDEIGRLGQSFEKMSDNLRQLIQQILQVTDQVASASEELTANSEQSAQAANQVAISTTQTALGADQQSIAIAKTKELVDQITVRAHQEEVNTKKAVEITQQAVEAATEGNKAVNKAIEQMNMIQNTVDDSANVIAELGERSKEIGKIVETISNIAGQTNLLALNAAIEAARAGEYGRGFAVVAEEVRKLAENSQESTKQIALLIGEVQAKTDTAVKTMTTGTAEVKKGTAVVDNAGAAFQNIMIAVQAVVDIAKGASDGLEQLAASSGHVLTAVKEIDLVSHEISSQAQNISAATEQQSASVEEISSSSRALANLAEKLQNTVQKFKV